jgi:hypothetical protein
VKVVELYDTNTSPLWQLASNFPEYLQQPDTHPKELRSWLRARYRKAELAIILYQTDGPIGYIAFDYRGVALNK